MKKWNNNEIEILKKLYGIKMVKEIQNYLPSKTINSIRSKARLLNLKGNPSKTRKKYSVNEDYFNMPNIENSYWSGFIAADGNIHSSKKNRLRIKISKNDKNHLKLFSQHCEYTGKIYNLQQITKKKKIKFYSSLEINSEKIIKDLNENYNITKKKTFTLAPPNISDNIALAYIKGYIDGDGCIYLEIPKRGKNRLRLHICGTYKILTWIKNIFDTLCPFNKNATVRIQRKNHKTFSYCIAGKKAFSILNILNSIKTPRLERKWNKICLIQNTIF